MKRPSIALLFMFIVCPVFAGGGTGQFTDMHKFLDDIFESISKIKTLYYRLNYQEKNFDNGKIKKDSSTTKYQKAPRRVYMKMSNGAELLWGPDVNEGDVLIHPNSFPYFNLNLNPNGYWMRKNQHHGIDAMGFDYFEDLMKAAIERAGKDFDNHFFYQGEITFNGFKCQHIVIIDPSFKYIPYTVQKGENIFTIAKKLCLNEYMILKHNPKVSSYTDVKEGQIIQVPSNYAVSVRLYIDEVTMLPVMMRVEDEKGLFEEYDYKELKLNPDFKTTEFSKDNKDYHF